ncbi:alpha/beta hydrolase [Massilia sp. PAMC28688]|uniref:alpha/beta fold hydrolase n=1 Tax=Massilia sp. PAMC28688 TaxID=2861283 RepID=UPI001C62A440|nr:alpha/beta hydrolase [Massilia sp. PAMC28688]QYF92728.1 alpha/beta hydrolase [Massilia sp. PAMC28688]
MRTVIPTRSPRGPSALQTAALLGVAGLAASFLYAQAKQRSAERDNPPQGNFVEVEGVRLHYVERGQGDTLVLLHGNGLFSNDFDLSGLLDSGARPYRVIAFDRPGFGYSDRPGKLDWTPEEQARLFYQALHKMGVERPIVVGHSWGTLVTLAMALNYPKYVRAITLMSGYYYPTTRADVPLMAAPAIPGIGQLLRHTVAPVLAAMLWPRLVKRMFAPAPVPERFQELPKWLALRPGQLGASAAETAMMIPAAKRLSERYKELTLPIAVVAGNGDEIVDVHDHAIRFHNEVRHSELIIEDGVGHMAHYADPARIMEAVGRLEASLTPGGANLRHSATIHSSSTELH